MARKTKTESAHTRERLLDAAEIEMQARGVSQTSLARIAQRAEVTRGAIYWHFADKSALLEAMISRTKLPLRDLRQCLAEHIPGDEPLWLLREMMRHGLNRLAHDARHRRVCHIVLHRCEMTEHGHPAQAVLSAMFDDARSVLLALCDEIDAQRQLSRTLTPADAADMIMAFMSGSYECVLRHPGTYRAARDWEPMIDALLAGLFDVQSLRRDRLSTQARKQISASMSNGYD